MSAVEKLPAAARAKLAAMARQADDAGALASAAQAQAEAQQHRLTRILRGQTRLGEGMTTDAPDAPKVANEADAAERELARLREVQAARHRRWRDAGQLLSQIDGWLSRQPPSAVFEVTPSPRIETTGEPPRVAVDRLRAEMRECRRELARVRAAPLPLADLKARLRETVEGSISAGRPRISNDRGMVEVAWRRPGAFSAGVTMQEVVALLCAAIPGPMMDLLDETAEATTIEGGVAEADRERQTAELRGKIAGLERAEEAIIEAAAAQGQDIPRRPDASPAAVLSIRIVGARELAAA
jgi:hypothetical protein